MKIAVDRTSVADGARLRYSYEVTATGTGEETQVVLTDPFPSNTQPVKTTATCDAVATCSIEAVGSTIAWHLGVLAAGQTARVSVQAVARAQRDAHGICPAGEAIINAVHVTSQRATEADASVSTVMQCTDVLGQKLLRKRYSQPTNLPPAVGDTVQTNVLGLKVVRTSVGSGMKVVRGALDQESGVLPSLPRVKVAGHSDHKGLWLFLGGILVALVLAAGGAVIASSRSATA